MVFYSEFLNSPKQINEQIEHGLKLGGEKALAFGSDFFGIADFPDLPADPGFFPELANSSCYPTLLKNLSQDLLEAIASKNATDFIETHQMNKNFPR